MNTDLIVVRQLPVIENQLRAVKEQVEGRVAEVLSMVCTEDTYKSVKSARAELNKEYSALEARRKEVKASILKPYEQFEAVYKECVGDIYAQADTELKAKITEVENGLKQQKKEEVVAYFEEYRDSLGIEADLATFAVSGITVTMSDSKKSLKVKAKAFLDRISGDLSLIATQEYKDEILVEYRKSLDVSKSITTVTDRHRAMEAERQRREEAELSQASREAAARRVAEVLSEEEQELEMPIAAPDPEAPVEPIKDAPNEKNMRVTFTVTAPRSKLIELRDFLKNGGYEYV